MKAYFTFSYIWDGKEETFDSSEINLKRLPIIGDVVDFESFTGFEIDGDFWVTKRKWIHQDDGETWIRIFCETDEYTKKFL